ncbi:hypothetical protein GCM10010297_36330 [Streptomyces malachitofuscus]|nr:hypothetical protein GCM10010297_36330 [Streptomyces malachitofuscus]
MRPRPPPFFGAGCWYEEPHPPCPAPPSPYDGVAGGGGGGQEASGAEEEWAPGGGPAGAAPWEAGS